VMNFSALEHGRDAERGTSEGRTKELQIKSSIISAEIRMCGQEYQDVKRHNDTLKSLVARYQKELKDRSHAGRQLKQRTLTQARLHPERDGFSRRCIGGDEY